MATDITTDGWHWHSSVQGTLSSPFFLLILRALLQLASRKLASEQARSTAARLLPFLPTCPGEPPKGLTVSLCSLALCGAVVLLSEFKWLTNNRLPQLSFIIAGSFEFQMLSRKLLFEYLSTFQQLLLSSLLG